jgi:hypothetical protein
MHAWSQGALVATLLMTGCAAPRSSEAEIDRLARASIESQKSGICNVHQVRMQRKLVPVEFSHLPTAYFSSEYDNARLREFPNAREYALTPNPGPQARREKTRRYVCSACKRAEREWMLKHPHDEFAKTLGPE